MTLKKKKSNQYKEYDFVIYYRNLKFSYNNYIIKLIKELISNGNKIAILGDKIYIKNVYNFGYLTRVKAQNIISKSRCSLNNPENLFSYFFQDCLSFNLKIFYNKTFSEFNVFKTKKLIPISYNNPKKDLKIILNNYKI
tara:strand:+ start:215 stop:631 length:417 start_codon:yes stop_codon:yes gene_type:complete